jgi:hypothetical protein
MRKVAGVGLVVPESEDLTQVEQKAGLSRNLSTSVTHTPGRSRAFVMVVTPTMRSWNQFSAFIEEWDELRMAA